MIICKAPAINYHGYALAEVIGIAHDTWGQKMVRVRALHGTPWCDAGLFGYSETAYAKFYPRDIEIVEECRKENVTA
jgi:hypothetical protein